MEIGRFSVERKLGAGSTGVVYAAWDHERDARVALKTLRRLDADALYRLKREFRSLANVTHPNLVDLYELGSAGDHWYLTMELVEGSTLLSYVRPGGRLDITRLRPALLQLAAGVAALHDSGHLHRDLKPSNVLVSAGGRVAICDFGLVTEVPSVRLRHTIEDCLAGTLAYLSPEQAALLPLTEASDWYSVGVILYEALTGRLPFEGTRQELLAWKQMLAPEPPSTIADVPADLDALCRELLSVTPERRPRGTDILQRLGSAPQTASVAPVFVGRHSELAALGDALEAAAIAPVVVVLHGPPGAGKTALARRFLEEVGTSRRSLILSGRCSERESVPYNAVDEILDDLSAWLAQLADRDAEACVDGAGALARLFPVLERVPAMTERLPWQHGAEDPGALRAEAFDAFRAVLGRLARRSQLVLWIDDLHWADQDSMALLAHALRSADAPPVLVVTTARDTSGRTDALLATLTAGTGARPDVRRFAIGTLSDAESHALADSLLPDAPPQAKAAVARESGGNPLLAHQLAGYVEHERVYASGLTLEQLVGARLKRLPAPSRRLLDTVAVAGGRVARRVAIRAAELPAESEAHAVASLREARLLRVSGTARGERIECFHDRVCEAVLAELAPATLVEIHARLAAALLRTDDPDPELLVRHYRGAHDHERAARFAAAAADQAARALAFDRAVRLYQLARQLRSWEPAARRELDEKLAIALCNAGRGADAASAYLELAEAVPSDALLYQRRAAEQLLRSGLVEQGIDVARTVLARVGLSLAPTPRRALLSCAARRGALRMRGLAFRERDPNLISGRDLARLEVCWSMAVGLGLVDVVRGFDFHTQHLQLALRSGDPARVLRGLALEACNLSAGGTRTAPRVRRLLDRIAPLADRVATPDARAWAAAAAGSASALSGQFASGLDSCERAVALFRRECTGVFWEVSSMELFSLWCLLYLGRIRDLSERVPRLIEQADERGDAFSATNLRTGWPSIRWLAADDPDAGRAEVADAMASWVRGPFHMQHYYELLALSHFDLYTGDLSRAWTRLDEGSASLRRSRVFSIQNVRIGLASLRGRLALALGDRHLLPEADRAATRLEREAAPWANALAALLRAGLAHRAGNPERCVDQLARAEADFAGAGMELHVHAARARRGELVGGATGQALRDEAAAWMHAQGIRRPDQMTALWTPGLP